MTRRTGQNPEVRVGKRSDGTKHFYFQYWIDVPGQEARVRKTEVIGPVKTPKAKTGKDGTVENGFTKSEAERKKLEFLANLNPSSYQLPSSQTFSDAVKFYREVFAPRMLRASTFDIADWHLKKHLEPDWNVIPMEHINIDSVNEWIWKKRKDGLSWVTIKNILRTMQRVLSPPRTRNPLSRKTD
jgi:hypothetical protein